MDRLLARNPCRVEGSDLSCAWWVPARTRGAICFASSSSLGSAVGPAADKSIGLLLCLFQWVVSRIFEFGESNIRWFFYFFICTLFFCVGLGGGVLKNHPRPWPGGIEVIISWWGWYFACRNGGGNIIVPRASVAISLTVTWHVLILSLVKKLIE